MFRFCRLRLQSLLKPSLEEVMETIKLKTQKIGTYKIEILGESKSTLLLRVFKT